MVILNKGGNLMQVMKLNLKNIEAMLSTKFVSYQLACHQQRAVAFEENMLVDCHTALHNIYTTVKPPLPEPTTSDWILAYFPSILLSSGILFTVWWQYRSFVGRQASK